VLIPFLSAQVVEPDLSAMQLCYPMRAVFFCVSFCEVTLFLTQFVDVRLLRFVFCGQDPFFYDYPDIPEPDYPF